jgi:ubiquinone biosynthesis protein
VAETIATRHGGVIAEQLGIDPSKPFHADMTGFKASLGLTDEVEGITYRELQARREIINERLKTVQRPKRDRRLPFRKRG